MDMATDTLTFQTALARLLTEPRELDRLYDDPAGFAAEHALDEGQMAALRSLDEKRLRWESQSLGSKRFSDLEVYFPATFALLDSQKALAKVERSLVMTHRPLKSEQRIHLFRDALWLGELIERLVDEGELDIPYLADVARCEHIELFLWSEDAFGESADEFKARNSSRLPIPREEVLDAVVHVGRHVALRAFSCDVLPLVQALAKGGALPAPNPTPTLILFGRVPGTEQVQKARVGRMTQMFLARADGVRKTREILAEIVDPQMQRAEREAVEQGCCRVLLQLRGLHFVTFEEGADAEARRRGAA
jgi:hypothetical protein